MTWMLRSGVLMAVVTAMVACGAEEETAVPPDMAAMPEIEAPAIPAVFGYYAGEEIAFIHPEASDDEVAELLTEMMGSPVLTVPSLATVPDEGLSDVYVFTDGVRPRHRGPFGYQADVFPTAPGDPGYTPLRRLVLVAWAREAEPRELRSADEVLSAEENGEVTPGSWSTCRSYVGLTGAAETQG